jgi:transposase
VANEWREVTKSLGAAAAIPSRAGRKVQSEYDRELHKERTLIERICNKLKHFRRVAARYDKLNIAYLAFLFLAGIYLWLKQITT